MRPGQRYSSSTMNNIDKLLALDHEEVRMGRGRYLSDPTQEPMVQTYVCIPLNIPLTFCNDNIEIIFIIRILNVFVLWLV